MTAKEIDLLARRGPICTVKRTAAIVLWVALFLAVHAGPADAVRNGAPEDGTQYGAVGAILAGPGHSLCTGTLITPFVVLTAAQCVRDLSPDPVFDFSLGPGRTARVTAVRVHPLANTFEGLNVAFDVALVRLDKAVAGAWTDVVPAAIHAGIVPVDALVTGVGFGETSTGAGAGARRSGILLVTQYIGADGPTGFVADAFLETVPGDVNDQMLCPGDQGGPLFHAGQLAGVASFRFVATCDEPGPGYYVTINRLATWIAATLADLDVDPPVARAGADQAIHAGQTVLLDGSGSFDNDTPTASLTFAWTLVSRPPGSGAVLSGADTPAPVFVADVPGDYVASLTVRDGNGLASGPDTVLVTSLNAPASADAGLAQAAVVGQLVALDGSASQDPDGDPFTFSWTLSAPAGSGAVLADATTAFPSFTPDRPGTYAATLTVTDSFGGATADAVLVSVITAADFVEERVAAALNEVGALPLASVASRGNQQALQNFLTQAIRALQQGDLAQIRARLRLALERTDGCALRGAPDGQGPGRDWITDCGVQLQLYAVLKAALDALGP